VANSAAYLAPRLAPGTDVLDVGCGPGTITADLARLVAPGRVVGIDTTPEVVEAAVRDHAAANLSFAVGDVHRLDHADESFDVVHAHQVLQHLADPVAALVEMRRVCRRDGVLAVRDADYGAMAWWPDNEGLRRWRDIYGEVARANGGEPDAGRQLVAWVRRAGFGTVEPSASAWCFANPEDRAWWARTWAERTTSSRLADRAVELGVATHDDLAACAEGWLTWASDGEASFLVPHGEVLASR
jgi:ubiquinone/menaquinone biosynthesis C-methylase UbiE